MTTIDRSFVDGAFWRMLVLGAILTAVAALVLSFHFAWSLAVGVLVGATSLRVTTFTVEKMIRALLDGTSGGAIWGVVVGLKLLALLIVVFVVLAVMKANAVAFVIGFKVFLPALIWQVLVSPNPLEDPDEGTDPSEST